MTPHGHVMEASLHAGSRLPILIMQVAVEQTARQGMLVETPCRCRMASHQTDISLSHVTWPDHTDNRKSNENCKYNMPSHRNWTSGYKTKSNDEER